MRARLSYRGLRSLGACVVFTVAAPGPAQDSASQLVRQGTTRLEEYREYVRQTGDLKGRAPILQQVLAELDRTCPVLAAAGDPAGAATCLVKAGDAERILSVQFMSDQMSADAHRTVVAMMADALRRYREGEQFCACGKGAATARPGIDWHGPCAAGVSAGHDYRAAAAAVDETSG
jgi:hypothetical protein